MSWKVEGTYMESCSCDAICPCIMLNAPTQGSCNALVGWRVEKGHYHGLDLGGLNVAVTLHSPGKMQEGGWDLQCFVDSKGTPEQRKALMTIFGGQEGGHPAVIASLVGNMVGVKEAAISFDKVGENYVVKVENVGEVEVVPTKGPDGGNITVHNHLLQVAPGFDVTVCSSSRSIVKSDLGDWDLSGHQCMYSPFRYSSDS